MNDLLDIYKRIEYLRNKGVKMKEMADHTNMAVLMVVDLVARVVALEVADHTKAE